MRVVAVSLSKFDLATLIRAYQTYCVQESRTGGTGLGPSSAGAFLPEKTVVGRTATAHQEPTNQAGNETA